MPHRVFNKSLFQLSDPAFCVSLHTYMKSCTNAAIPETLGSGAGLRFSDRLNIKYSSGAMGVTEACKRAFPTLNGKRYDSARIIPIHLMSHLA